MADTEEQEDPSSHNDEEDDDEEEDLEKLQAEIARMEAEAERISQQQKAAEEAPTAAATAAAAAPKPSNDKCSVYVGQVEYSSTPQELAKHFAACGTVERVTIVCDKFTGQPKGFAYVEFETEASVANALKLEGSEFKGRQLKVTPKRVNQPGMGNTARGRGRGRGGSRGRGGRGRGGYRGGFRGRGRGGAHHPYY